MSDTLKYSNNLELEKILEKLKGYVCCSETKQLIDNISPCYDFSQAKELMNKTVTAHKMLCRYQTPPIYGLKNLDNALNRAKIGAILSLRELLDVETLLRNAVALKNYRDNCEEDKTDLDDLFYSLIPIRDLADNIKSSIISEEEIDDNASGDLRNIRRAIKKAQANIRTNLDKIIHSTTYQKYLQESIITMRDGRFVVPVKSEYRNEVKGLVHDTSSSGSTVFIEPLSVVEENNEVKLLQQKEKQEIERILLALSGQVGDNSDIISQNYKAILELDLYFSKAKYALQMDAVAPTITNDGKINLVKAKHPLIDKNVAVPININLGNDFDTLIVTGPNTGGKTVSLKTLGLLTLMTMCGIMIPAHQSSSVSVFDKVLASIGDEQSIEQSLSTFSSQMTKIVRIIDMANKNSLVILDELGSGTDPIEGAALAIAIIEKVTQIGSKIAATTHYPELKLYALTTQGVENACCEFDVVSLRPTYKLLIGVPGKSNAFEISKKLGLADEIIDNAREKVSSENTEFEDVVSKLENTRQELEREKEQVDKIKRENEQLLNELNAEKKALKNKADIEIQKARAKAKTILEQTRYKSDEIINELEEIKKNKALGEVSSAKSKSNKVLDELEDIANPVDRKNNTNYKLPRNLKRGDIVVDSVFNQQGTVLSDPDGAGFVYVQIGFIKQKVKQNTLRLVESKREIKKLQKGTASKKITSNATRKISRELDIRGVTVEEGIMEVDSFIDGCVLSGVDTVTIIHGKGTGALRSAIQAHLKGHKNVKSYRNGVYGEGEMGVTVVEIK